MSGEVAPLTKPPGDLGPGAGGRGWSDSNRPHVNVSSYHSVQHHSSSGLQKPAITAATSTTPHLSLPRKLAYGVGHVFNDLCASMWFTYLVLFFHKVALLGNTYAGLLILIGQVADAAATPFIGFLCDKTHLRYGRRKFWHLVGTIMVGVSLFFFWHTCLPCQEHGSTGNNTFTDTPTDTPTGTPLAWKIVYFSIPIVIFQFGWASVQISHLSLIPELTSDKNERVGLNAIRYACK